ncbi:conserved domain protein, putative [Synechococcus sp. PCC 7335]|uniref:sulfite exporter TauE/SafE family protein n=1 Tax=Synechococcus sp. (strain ATCC 29403 / PCC 7335) TaxID=91464 RepID=UPI00017EE032|nr:TSUP family transporter [Synechococcus sp. PCC 7335]EDX87865.1 conserved domain protein, putative [Synechococcus sp. PCC 7335]
MILLAVFAIGLVAGFVDAIAGGGGLIMLPGLLFTGLPVGSAIATNKLCGTFGSLTSTLKFAQSQQIDWSACKLMALPIIIGAYLGSRSIGLLPSTWAEPIVVTLMAIITLFVIFKPGFGIAKVEAASSASSELQRSSSVSKHAFGRTLAMIFAGGAIGFHDGFFGPGTGIFLVFSLLSLASIDFLRATGTTKLLNFLANFTALVTFATTGSIDYSKGLSGALGVILGSFLGATFATRKGAQLIKPIFVVVTIALIVKLLVS